MPTPDKTIQGIRPDLLGLPLLILLLGGFLLFMNTFLNNWSFDDYFVILNNPDVTSLNNFMANEYQGRPLRELSFLLDYSLFGFNPFGWHFQNIFWHAMNAWLVYVVAMLLCEERRVAWLAALLFLAHPIQVEVVAQISHRKDSLSLFFMLSAFVTYLLFVKNRRWYYLSLCIVLSGVAVLAKENAIVFPLFLVLFHRFYKPDQERTPYENAGLFALLLLVAVAFVVKMQNFDYVVRANALLVNNQYFDGFSVSSYSLAVLNAWAHNAVSLFWPVNLAVNYLLPVPESLLDFRILCSLFLIATYLCVLAYSIQHHWFIFWTLLWFGILSLPISNILPINHLAADRYLYAPSAGLFMGVAYIAVKAIRSRNMQYLLILPVACLCLLTFQQNSVWRDNVALWVNSLDVNPGSARALSNVGFMRYQSEPEINLKMQLRATEINPLYPFSYIKAARIYEDKGEGQKAYEYYQKAYDIYDPTTYGMYRDTYDELVKKLSAYQESNN